MKTTIALFVAALLFIGYSATIPPYTDQASFDAEYARLGAGDSQKFYDLRERMLSPKYKLQDYGITALLFAVGLLFANRTKALRAPRSTFVFVVTAVAVPLGATAALVFDLVQGASRDEYPHWADSLGIPLMGAPVVLVITMIWSLAHLTFLAGVRRSDAPLSLALSREAHPWLALVSAATSILFLGLIVEGAYWYALPCAVWLYLYASLAAVRRAHNGT